MNKKYCQMIELKSKQLHLPYIPGHYSNCTKTQNNMGLYLNQTYITLTFSLWLSSIFTNNQSFFLAQPKQWWSCPPTNRQTEEIHVHNNARTTGTLWVVAIVLLILDSIIKFIIGCWYIRQYNLKISENMAISPLQCPLGNITKSSNNHAVDNIGVGPKYFGLFFFVLHPYHHMITKTKVECNVKIPSDVISLQVNALSMSVLLWPTGRWNSIKEIESLWWYSSILPEFWL